MEKSLEQWKKDHAVPLDGLLVEVVSWDHGDWRSLRPRKLTLRVRWVERRYDWKKWSEFDFDTWQSWITSECRPSYYMYPINARSIEKRRIMQQLEMYAAAMGYRITRPRSRASAHTHMGVDVGAPGGVAHFYNDEDGLWNYKVYKG